MSQWIWKFGEFEIYHNLLVHYRRQQYGYPEPVGDLEALRAGTGGVFSRGGHNRGRNF